MSLIEVLMVAVVVTVSLGVALPSFESVLASGRMRTARSRLTVTLAQARNEAVVRGREVVVCPTAGDGSCADSIEWQHGWMSFADDNGNGTRDADELPLVLAEAAGGVRIVATGGRRLLRYRPDGSSAGSNVTLTFCDRRGAGHATALALNNAGRLRQTAVSPENAALACAG
jgi:type IV fimbrial biogenesis protein FimT